MGCCLSTKREPAPCLPKDQNVLTDLNRSIANRAPPPAPTEEETVKEVLSVSETPKPIIVSPKPKPPLSHIESVDLKDPDLADDAVSEPARSELSSSTVTYEEEREVRSSTRRVMSSPGSNSRVRARPEWNAGAGRDRVVGRSPLRRSDLSPARRGGGGGPVLAAGMRSRSPAAIRSTATGRPPSNRRMSQSPGRVRANSGERLKKVEENDGGGGSGGTKRPSSNPNLVTDEAEINPNESLEDPHVSLECFIFL